MARRPQRAQRGEVLLHELKAIAERLGVFVREEKLLREVGYQARSGGCRLGGKEMIFLDSDLPLADRIDVLAAALRQHDLQDIYLPPALRALLERGTA